MGDEDEPQDLPEFLVAALPVMLSQVAQITPRQRLAEAEKAADIIACGADILWAPEKIQRKAELSPDEVRRGIVAGIAILAHRLDGVTFGGLHWCAAAHDDCPGAGEWTIPGWSVSRTARGAVFTPRELAEEVTDGTLEALVYKPGPLQTNDRAEWRLIPSGALLKLTIGDIAVGSGAFLLAACRYLADRLVEIWFKEAGHPMQELPPYNPMTMAARRQVMRCLYAVDIDPLSVELAKLSLTLLAPNTPMDLSSRIACGDSLLGLSNREQLKAMHMDPAKAASPLVPIHDPELMRILAEYGAHTNREAVA